MAHVASSSIRHRLIGGNVVILDLRSGEYKILDEVASAMWEIVLAQPDQERCTESLIQTFDVERERVAIDLKRFVSEAEEGGLLSSRPSAPIAVRDGIRWPKSCLAAGAWWSLLTTTSTLAKKGFAHTYLQLAACAKSSTDNGDFAARLACAERAFSLAENFFILRSAPNDCLPRSLSLYRFLIMAGIPADHIIGVRRFPFQAHAWVECTGRVLFDLPDFVQGYAELARI